MTSLGEVNLAEAPTNIAFGDPDLETLYIAARMYQDPKTITARILRQGEQVFGDDWFSVMIDPFHDKRSGYRFQTNPNGLRQEALYQNVSTKSDPMVNAPVSRPPLNGFLPFMLVS